MLTINITAHAENASQIAAVKTVMKALKIKFTIAKEKPYDPEFVAKIEQSRQDYKDGNFVSVQKDELKKFLGLE